MPTITSTDLLTRAVELWTSTRRQYRDGLLEVGQLLHEFILSRLIEGDGKNEAQRALIGSCRRRAVRDAAVTLSTSVYRINELVRVAAVVDLLSDGDCGGLSYSAIREFQRVIRRVGKGKETRRNLRDSTWESSSRETWEVWPELAKEAPDLFRRSVDGKWKTNNIVDALNEMIPRCLVENPKYLEQTRSVVGRWVKTIPRLADEFESASMLCLLDASRKYDQRKGSFGNYLGIRLDGAMRDVCRNDIPTGFGRGTVADAPRVLSGELASSQTIAIADSTPTFESLDSLTVLTRGLDPRTARMVIGHFCEGRTFAEVGSAEGIKESRASQLVKEAMSFLREKHGVQSFQTIDRKGKLIVRLRCVFTKEVVCDDCADDEVRKLEREGWEVLEVKPNE